ncbi:MAG TPA: GAF domain-containing sensor histidine kinase [Gemmatimonadaceae bacterium]|nr:GAF domain-containing sensor histidine kinase [Gemmatimonadaceae bacterium]
MSRPQHQAGVAPSRDDTTTADRDLGILNALAQALIHSRDLAQVLHTALDTVAGLLALDTGWVWLTDETTGDAQLAATRNLPPGLIQYPQLMAGPCYCLDTYRAGDLRGAANVNVVRCSRLSRLVEGTNDLQCHASIPLYADDRKLGILNVASRDWRELSAGELDLLYTVGALVSLAIERTRLAARSVRLAAAEERNRLAREIHDTLAQSLAAITMQLETADALATSNDDARLADTVQRALTLTRATLDEARRSVMDLRPAPLEGRRLTDALRELGDELSATGPSPLDIRVDWEGDDQGLPPAVEIGLYRIAREALANVARHAGASRATVHVRRTRENVRMRIQDDGVGFDPLRTPPARFGIVGMTERARLLGGMLHVESGPNAGTIIDVELPLRSGFTPPRQ